MLQYLGLATVLLAVGLVGIAYNEFQREPSPTQRAEIPCSALDGVNVVVTADVTGMALTKENMELLKKKICGSIVK